MDHKMFPAFRDDNGNRGGTARNLALSLICMSHGPAQKTAPRHPRLRDAWRAACVEYRACRREGHYEWICTANARATLWRMMPGLTYEQVAHETIQAISYASVMHPSWFWAGTSGVPPRPKRPFIPPHIIKDPEVLWRMGRESAV
ncbi:hypothetical protein [Hyphomicrobium sp. DY-1]|uniref:hypothetical protein n=1 Tax=Hyphomicrobium sp. DY-1 TaxID=3075650 RepID=UPI0039C3179F